MNIIAPGAPSVVKGKKNKQLEKRERGDHVTYFPKKNDIHYIAEERPTTVAFLYMSDFITNRLTVFAERGLLGTT
jgi:hypothetical protein